eukprot:CAMPEP_0179182074 /NCGR_PEP_ID=MMETSP0796-20121207/90204_1 /TAXON_ID=73915 /ORGANISM="Pyrodinium bahamense, Strain pbaha01" /LENGTH=201 /DNA_ID=CAMNT_0020885897 /DNA_START=6 /DNA_END=608 /DNA_ORIENTATION=+
MTAVAMPLNTDVRPELLHDGCDAATPAMCRAAAPGAAGQRPRNTGQAAAARGRPRGEPEPAGEAAQCGLPGGAEAYQLQAAAKEGAELGPFASPDCESIAARFELLEALGQGSTAVVYRARRRADGQLAALKTIRVGEEELLQRAREEFELLQGIRHPHIIRAHELFTHPCGVVLVLEFFEGHSLDVTVFEAQAQRFGEAT